MTKTLRGGEGQLYSWRPWPRNDDDPAGGKSNSILEDRAGTEWQLKLPDSRHCEACRKKTERKKIVPASRSKRRPRWGRMTTQTPGLSSQRACRKKTERKKILPASRSKQRPPRRAECQLKLPESRHCEACLAMTERKRFYRQAEANEDRAGAEW